MPKPASLTVISAAGVVPIAPRPVAAYFGSDCLRKDNRAGHDHTLNCNCSGWGFPHTWSVKTARKARHSYVMKFLLVELSQLRSSVVRAPARKAEDLGFDSRAGHTLFAWIWLFIAPRRVIEKVVDNWRGKHLNRLAWLVRPSALALPQIGQSSSILFGEFHHQFLT